MAKSSKKSETGNKEAGGSQKKAAAKKSPAKEPASSGNPMIDTSLAAENAAKLLFAKFNNSGSKNSIAPNQESSMFKQMKAGLNKPSAGSAMSNLLGKSHGPDPIKNLPMMKQVGHNQTIGEANVTRSGVPRRNPG